MPFLREHDISAVVHGDDISEEAIAAVYPEVSAAGMLHLVPRRSSISTTELIRRVRQQHPGDQRP
jgi:glycerol-3-phosphate cytidylyltransferase-like family protein